MVKTTLIILLTLFAAFSVTNTTAFALPNIDKLADAGKFEQVIAVCDKSIRQNPKDTKAFGIRAWAKYRLSRFSQSVEDCNAAISLDKNYGRAYRYRASAKYELKRFKDSIDDCNRALSLDPQGDHCAFWQRGIAHLNLHENAAAIADLTKAISLSEFKCPEYFGDRGFAYQCAGKYDQAIDDFDMLLSHFPSGPWAVWAHWQRGQTFYFWKQYRKSIDACSIAIRLDPKLADAYITKNWSHYCLKEYDLALREANTAVSLKPNESKAYICRGNTYWKMKDKTAISDLKRAAELENSARRYHDLAFCCADFNQEKEGDEALTKAIEIELKSPQNVIGSDPPLLMYRYARGISRFKLAQYELAIEDFDRAVNTGSVFDGFIYGWRAKAQYKLGNLDCALRDCDEALRHRPLTLCDVFETKTLIHEKQGLTFLANLDRLSASFENVVQNVRYPRYFMQHLEPVMFYNSTLTEHTH